MKINYLLISGFLVIALVVGAATIIQNRFNSEDIIALVERENPKMEAALEMEINVNEVAEGVFDYLSQPTSEEKEHIIDDIDDFNRFFDIYSEKARTEEEKQTLSKIKSLFEDFVETGNQLLIVKDEQIRKIEERRILLNEEIEVILDDKLQKGLKPSDKLNYLHEMETNVHELISAVRGYILKQDAFLKDRAVDSINDFEYWQTQLLNIELTEGEKSLLAEIDDHFKKVKVLSQEILDLEDRKQELIIKFREQVTGIDALLDEDLQAIASQKIREDEQRVINLGEEIGNRTLIIDALIILLAILLGIFFSRLITRPIRKLTKEVDEITKGKLDIHIEESKIEEVAGLTESLNRILASLKLAILRTGATKSELGLGEAIKAKEDAEAKLKESEERFKLAMKGSNDGLWDWNLKTNKVYFSPRWKSMIGYEEDEIKDDFSEWESRLHPDDKKRATAYASNYVKSGGKGKFEIEFKMKHKDGNYVDILARAFMLKDNEGKPIRLVGTHVDITKRKENEKLIIETNRKMQEVNQQLANSNQQLKKVIVEREEAESEVRKSENKYHELFDSSKDGIIFTDMQGNIQEINQAYADMLGYKKEDVKKLTYQQLTPKKWHEYEAKIVKNKIIKEGYSGAYEKEYIRKDKTIFPISIIVWLIKDKKGKPKGMWGIVRDITERKKTEEKLKKEHEYFENIFEFTNESLVLVDEGGSIINANKAASKKLGHSSSQLIGKSILKLHPKPDSKKCWNKLSSVFKGQKEVVCDCPYIDSKKRKVDAQSSYSLIGTSERNYALVSFRARKDICKPDKKKTEYDKAINKLFSKYKDMPTREELEEVFLGKKK